MRGRLLPTLLAVLTTLVLCAGTAPAATASAGVRVTPGGTFTGTGGSVNAPPVTCGGSRITGRFNAFDHMYGNPFGVIDGITYQNCSGFFTAAITVIAPWKMVPTAHSNGVTTINLTDIAATLTGPGCQYTVAGQASTSYNNATGILTVYDNLIVSSVNGCFGLVSPGQRVTLLSRSYVISPRQVIEPV